MFYFTDTNTGEVISLESKDVKIAWQDGTGTIIYGVKANRVYTSAEAIATIYARNAPQDMIFATDTKSGKSIFVPLVAIKDIRPFNTGGVIYYNSSQTRQQEINETPIAIVNALAVAVAGQSILSFTRNPLWATNPPLYHWIQLNMNVAPNHEIDLGGLLGPIAGKTLYVTTDGDDTLALTYGKYNEHKPWRNPTVAMANAVAGDLVVVTPGVYTIGDLGGEDISDDGLQYLVRNNVTLYMMPGAVIYYTNFVAADGLTSLPFTDGGVASTFIIRGYGKFIFNRSITGGDTFLCTTNIGTVLDWEFDTIDIRKRFETSGHDSTLWRMVGRQYINRESMLFALRFPPASTYRKVYIKFEETIILEENANNTWTRAEIRSFGPNSVAYIDFGKVSYPHAYPLGALFQKTLCSSLSTIDFYATSVVRTNNDGIRDFIIVGVSDESNSFIDVKNIDTPNGLCLYSLGSAATIKKTENYQGKIRNGYTGAGGTLPIAQFSGPQNHNIKLNLDVVVNATVANYLGITMLSALFVSVSGKIIWHHPTNPPILIPVGGTGFGRLENLILSEIDPAVPSVLNQDAAPKNLRVMGVYATTAVSPANGGVVQLIETIVVNSNV